MLAVAVLSLAGAKAAPAFTTGYLDGRFADADGAVFDDAEASGAGAVRIPIGWGGIAPRRPRDPANPDDPRYNWAGVDAAVAAARQRGLEVLLSVDGVPRWAQGKHRPKRYADVTYEPDAKATGAFATAVARHFRGQARYLQLLNEPNLFLYLAPQWRKGRPFAPVRYRQILNAAYPGVHAAGMKLVTAGTAPYGDPGRRGLRIRPRTFWRIVFNRPVYFDVLAHHPYAIDGPRRPAYSSNDIAVPDMYRLVSLVRSAVRRGTALPRRRKPVWVTEIGWDSRPPDPQGIPMKRFTKWVADSLFVLWKQRVDHVFWFLVRDQPPNPSFAATRQSGIYFANGRPKPALRAFRFPFSCERRGSGTRFWMFAPQAGAVRLSNGRVLQTGSDRIAVTTVPGRPRLYAVSAGVRSISCSA